MKSKITAPAIAAIAALGVATGTMAASPEKSVSVVLVHGAFVDGSGWKAVYDILTKDGYEVLVVQNPTVSLEGDVAATQSVIAAARHPVVLVGHSYGGVVITQAGDNPKVKSLVYLAAFAPDTGESVAGLGEKAPPPGEESAPLLPPRDGFFIVDPAKFPTSFAADVPLTTTRFMAQAQVPWGLAALTGKITSVAWKVKPASYLVATDDKMIPPTAQRGMAARSGAKVSEIKSSHAVMLSHPNEVAALIEAAVPVK